MRKKLFTLILPIILFIGGFFLASPFASPKTVSAQTCTTPAQVTGVEVQYPSCDSAGNCDFTQAACAWTAVSDAANYQVTMLEVETGTTVYNQQVGSTTLNVSVAITQNRTYRCSVSAINSCGQAGPAGTHELLCAADAAVTVTAAPTASPTLAVKPTVPAAGNAITGAFMLAGSAILIVAGLAFFLI